MNLGIDSKITFLTIILDHNLTIRQTGPIFFLTHEVNKLHETCFLLLLIDISCKEVMKVVEN
jgi:hypothetical protein